jgi:hypothetical protein
MPKPLLTLLCLMIFGISMASSVAPFPHGDTPRIDLRTTASSNGRCDFLLYYGREDTSRALIEYYFAHRAHPGNLFRNVEPDMYLGAVALMVTVMAVGSPLMIYWGSKFSRKKLLIQLKNYFDGGHVPRSIARDPLFIKAVSGKSIR